MMIKSFHIFFGVLILAIGSLLSACQLPLSSYGISSPFTNGKLVDEDYHPIYQLTISCEGTYHCEITQVDKTAVIDTQTHLPNLLIKTSDKVDEALDTINEVDIRPLSNLRFKNDRIQ